MPCTLECDYCQLPIFTRRAAVDGPIYCCYGCSLAARITRARGEAGQVNWMLTRLGVAVFLTMAIMELSLHLYGREVYISNAPETAEAQASLDGIIRYLCMIFSTPVLFILGGPIFSNAVQQWRQGIASTDALVMLGVIAAYVHSYVATFTDSGGIYFETACVILILLTLGRWLEARGKLRAADTIKSLERLIPTDVTIERGAEERTIPSDQLQIDDIVLVCAGRRIAVDGRIVSGRASIDEQIVTGESTPVVREVGDRVRAGTLNLDGLLRVRVTAIGAETSLGRLVRLLEEAKRSRGQYQRLADRVAAIFVPLTMGLAFAAGLLGWQRGGWDEALMSALALMLIACPCALGIATPTAAWVALGRAASKGALLRNGEALERLAVARTIFFDKTGTLTTGEPVVSSFRTATGNGRNETALSIAAGLGMMSEHAVSRGIRRFARQQGVAPLPVATVRTIGGRGLAAEFDRGPAYLGNIPLMQDLGLRFDGELSAASQEIVARGDGIALVGYDDAVQGVFALSETLRSEAPPALRELKSLGCRVAVLTGDHRARGAALAERLDVEVASELLPADKLEIIRRERPKAGVVAMVGDGLNDAPALAAADVGIALGCGTDVARESAAICLLGNDLATLPWLVRLARRTVRTIKVNLFWAFAYNVVGMSLALTGRLSPVFSALAMVASSLFVLTNSLRLADGGNRDQTPLKPVLSRVEHALDAEPDPVCPGLLARDPGGVQT